MHYFLLEMINLLAQMDIHLAFSKSLRALLVMNSCGAVKEFFNFNLLLKANESHNHCFGA